MASDARMAGVRHYTELRETVARAELRVLRELDPIRLLLS